MYIQTSHVDQQPIVGKMLRQYPGLFCAIPFLSWHKKNEGERKRAGKASLGNNYWQEKTPPWC